MRGIFPLSLKKVKSKPNQKALPKPKLANALFRKLPGNFDYCLTTNYGPFGAGPWLRKVLSERF